MKTKIPLLVLVMGLACLSDGCSISRKKPKTPPPPPAATPRSEPRPVDSAMPEPRLREPVVAVPKTEPKLAPPAPVITEVEPPKPAPAKKRTRRNSRSTRSTSKQNQESAPPDGAVPAEQQTPPPRLGEVLSASQRKEMLAHLEGNVAAARRILAGLAGRSLSPERAEEAGRVRAFIEQALGMREADLGTGVELSRRALVLAQDLAGRGP